jgi:hypothetical protein
MEIPSRSNSTSGTGGSAIQSVVKEERGLGPYQGGREQTNPASASSSSPNERGDDNHDNQKNPHGVIKNKLKKFRYVIQSWFSRGDRKLGYQATIEHLNANVAMVLAGGDSEGT